MAWLFKVVVRACYGAYLVAHVFKYLAPNFVSGDLHDAALIISVQLSVEPLIAHALCNFQHAQTITSVVLLNYRAYPT